MTLTAQTIQIVLAAIVLCFSSIAVHGQAQSPTGNSTINGIVVYSDTGRPLRHARITLLPEEAGWEQTAVSDLRGRFVFRDVPAGMCRLTIDAPGILTALMP
ncbi:MAG TPA: carboxypeptidase-like regulatory domain-containing protein, partial [Pyrinomonadaceae bacterium]|nr:carboxypeptidase-like regulatory domain-containing protein [Pyrinomonadaceae bacterium]